MSVIARLTVPQNHVKHFVGLAHYSGDGFDSLASALAEPNVGIAYAEVRDLFQQTLEREDMGVDGEGLLDALISLQALHASHGWSLKDISESVSKSDKIDLGSDERTRLSERIDRLVTLEALANLAKAIDLASEREHIFHTSRIITDIRPVFGDDPKVEPAATVVVQTLRISYIDTSLGRRQTFEVALSEDDVRKLHSACERAIDKASTIVKSIERAGLRALSTEVD